jgi:hypothetical protein
MLMHFANQVAVQLARYGDVKMKCVMTCVTTCIISKLLTSSLHPWLETVRQLKRSSIGCKG